MAAATGPITYTEAQGERAPLRNLTIPVKAATTIYAGTIVVVDAGYACPARTATGLLVAGRATETVINSGSAGAKSITVERGAFTLNNSSAGDLLTQADLLKTVYLVDDNTVAKTDGSSARSAGGKLVGFRSDGRPIVEMY